MAKLTRTELHDRLGLRLIQDYTNNNSVVGGWQYSDSAVMKIAESGLDISGISGLQKYVNDKLSGALTRTAEAKEMANQKRQETEGAKARQADRQAKLDAAFVDGLRRDFLLGNPGASEADFQNALPALKSSVMIDRTKKQKEALARQYSAKWSSEF